jgi:CheY-like chemotaxis protein
MKKRICFVDDAPIESEPIQDALQPDYEVTFIFDIDKAVNHLKQDINYDCIIIDLILPNTTIQLPDNFLIGFELIKYLRNVLKYTKTIIVLTVVTSEELLGPIRPFVNEILIKPSTPSHVKRTVEKLLK